MRRKILLITLLVLLMLFAAATLISLPVNAEENAEKSKVETTDVQPEAVVFSETFEGAFPGTAWVVGDSNSASGLDYWDDTSYRAQSGSWSGWCADEGTRETTIFSEGFEGNWPGSWIVGDSDLGSGYDSWGRSSSRKYAGTYSAWCAGDSDHPYGANYYDLDMQAYMYRTVSLGAYSSVTLSYRYWTDNEPPAWDYLQVMYRIGTTWTYTDKHTGYNNWLQSSVTIPNTANAVGFYFYSDNWQEPDYAYYGSNVDDITLTGIVYNSNVHQYDNNMRAYMYRATSLGAYSSVTLSYWYWTNNEPPAYDYLQVIYWSGASWYYIDKHTGNSGGWQYSSVSIPTTATYVGFYFYSDDVVDSYEGSYVDDVVLTGTGATYSVTINAACYTENAYISIPITMDGSPSGWSTPHTFTLSGTHTFTVPSTDVMGHPFIGWWQGGTSTTITVSSAGTYYALYQAAAQPPTVEIWTEKATYARGETLKVYVQGFNPGPATTVKVIAWFGLPGGGTYGLETIYNGPVPASYTGPVTLWKQFTIPTSAAVGTYSVNAEIRNPTTNALIDSDTYYFTVT